MRVMRINFSHATFEEAELRLTNLRAVSFLVSCKSLRWSLTLRYVVLVASHQPHTTKALSQQSQHAYNCTYTKCHSVVRTMGDKLCPYIFTYVQIVTDIGIVPTYHSFRHQVEGNVRMYVRWKPSLFALLPQTSCRRVGPQKRPLYLASVRLYSHCPSRPFFLTHSALPTSLDYILSSGIAVRITPFLPFPCCVPDKASRPARPYFACSTYRRR